MNKDSLGFSGRETFSFKITQNTARLLEINNNLALQYRKPKHIFLFLSNLSYTLSEETSFENNGFFHLRYNYVQSKVLTYELFSQYQTDIPLRIEKRILMGAGPRISFLDKEKTKFILGTLAMYEHDDELNNDITHDHVRLSSYLSAAYTTPGFTGNALMYYQPRIDYWSDYRVSGEFQVNFKIWKSLFFTSTASLNYDAFPVEDPEIPNLTYKITNGITYSF